MRIQVVCRASLAGGLGHLFRASSLCRAAQARGHTADLLAILAPGLEDLKDTCMVPVLACHSDEDLLPHLAPAPDVRVFDLNDLAPKVFAAACRGPALTATLSPVFAHMGEVDVLFSRSPREAGKARRETISGYDVAVVSAPHAAVNDGAYESLLAEPALPVAVSIGGDGAAAHTVDVLTSLMRVPNPLALWIHVGEKFTSHMDELVDAMENGGPHRVVLMRSSRSPWATLRKAALAIMTDGTLLFDALHAGVPAVVLAAEHHQSDIVRDLLERNAVLDGGSILDRDLDHLVEAVTAACRNRPALNDLRRRGRSLVDGLGADRILNHLSDMLAKRAG